MELKQLQKELRSQFSTSNISIFQENIWCVPVHTVNVSYKPVVRSTMDILMKMILISLQKAKIRHAEQLSEILLVEELFIQDLLTKMQKTQLITKEENYYQLTDKGNSQLASGVFEEDQELTTIELLYSPTHRAFLHGEIEAVLDYEDFPEDIYRYQIQQEPLEIDEQDIVAQIHRLETDEEDTEAHEKKQLVINAVESIEDVQINDVPCIEFVLVDQEKKKVYSRIWNTLLDNWDSLLQQQLDEKEVESWKEKIFR